MSAGAVFQEVLRVVVGQSLPEISQQDVVAALEAGRPGPLELLYEAGAEAGLPPETIVTRSVASYFFFCTANLCDDLSDGDCTYLADPYRVGPCAQLALQTLFFHALLRAELPSRTMSKVLEELTAMAGAQHIELHTKQWTAPAFRQVAEGIAGRQWSAYLEILWFGTALAGRAPTIGMNVGIAAHVAKDIQSCDPRYTTLGDRDKREIIAWARGAAQELRREHLRCIDAVLMTIDPVLERAP